MKKTKQIEAVLRHRHYGVHSFVKKTPVPPKVLLGEEAIDEDLLLKSLPEGWLPVEPRKILLLADSAISTPVKFACWGKYFDAYSLTVEDTSGWD